jgi:hypothetical protein
MSKERVNPSQESVMSSVPLKSFEQTLAFLHEHTRSQPHSGRTLYDHLLGTHKLLVEWGRDEATCLAGLFHSIYGSYNYRRVTVPVEQRHIVAGVIGEDAEMLAYLFSYSRRPRAFFTATRTYALDMRNEDQPKAISKETLIRLVEIECANEVEQSTYGFIQVLSTLPFVKELDAGFCMKLREAIGASSAEVQ